MGLVRPVTKTLISSTNFGQPVYDMLLALQAAMVPGPWINLTMATGWGQWVGGGYDFCGARLEQNGTVMRLRGMALRTGAQLVPGDLSTVASYPVSFPAVSQGRLIQIGMHNGSTRGDIFPTRSIQFVPNGNFATQSFISFDGITVQVP